MFYLLNITILFFFFSEITAQAAVGPSRVSKNTVDSAPVDRQENKQIAVAVFVKGEVKVGSRRLKMGDKLTNGEVIKTGDKASCDIQMTSTSSPIVIRIKEKSSFQLTETKQGDETKISSIIDSGKAIFNVSKLNSKEKMEVVTPTQTCGVRGTKFEMGVKPNGKERTLVTDGKVSARARIAKLEDLEHAAVESFKKSVRSNEREIEAGSYISFSKEDSDELLKRTGLQEVLENSEDENFSENLEKTVTNPGFQNEFNSSLKKLSTNNIQKLDEKSLMKKTYTFEELIPVEPHLLERKGLMQDFLKHRNKEKNMISLIRKLQEENENLKSELDSLKTSK